MAYQVEIRPGALRIFKKLPKEVKTKIIAETQILKTNPLKGEQLKGKYKFLHSLHFNFKGSAYRIIYQISSKTSTVIIRLAGTRENIYGKLKNMKIKSISF